MKAINQLARFFFQALNDKRVLPSHISLYLALFWNWKQHNFSAPFPVYRKDLMNLAHINSIATYHKCIKELSSFGYIGYMPSYNYHQGSLVYLSDGNENQKD
jgi:hypothetical protein